MPRRDGEASSPRRIDFGPVIAFGLSSASIIYVNKIVLKLYEFEFTLVLLWAQLLVNISLLTVLWRFGVVKLPSLTWKLISKVSVLTLFFTCDIFLGMSALRIVNIPMFTALRRLTILMVFILEWVVLHIVPTYAITRAIMIAMVGAVLAGVGDLTYDPLGYFMAFIADMTTASYRIIVKKLQLNKLDSFSLMYCNYLLAFPFIFGLSVFNGDLQGLRQYKYLNDPSFQAWFLLSCILAFLLNYSTFLCTQVNSPLTTSVTGQAKNAVVLIVGFFAFGDVKYHPLNVLGHAICLLGSIMYFMASRSKVQKLKQLHSPRAVVVRSRSGQRKNAG